MRLRDSALRGRAGASRWSGPLAVGTAVMGTLVLVLALSRPSRPRQATTERKVTIKLLRPTMGLVAVWWLLRAAWHPLAITVATGVGLVVVTLPVVGVGGWLDYATLLRNVGDITGAPANVDLASAVTRLGAPAWAASLAMIAGYASAALAVVLSLRRDRELSFVVTIGATLLVTPLLWDHYMTQILIPAAFLAARGRPWGLALPLLSWLPPDLLPFVALTALWLPFLASDDSRRPALAANAQARA